MGLMRKTGPAGLFGGECRRKRAVVCLARGMLMSYRGAQLGERQCRGMESGLVGRKITRCRIVLSSCLAARIMFRDLYTMDKE